MEKLLTVSLVEMDGVRRLEWQSDQADIANLDQLISILGQFRETLEPPIRQSDPLPGDMIYMLDDPRWVGSSMLDDKLLLAFRHPGFGWLGFQLHQQSEDALLALLLKRQSEKSQQPGPAH